MGSFFVKPEGESLEDVMLATPPSYAEREVTDDSFFEGGNLCHTTHADLLRKLSMLE
jgi:hypothetical protein